MVYFFCLIVAVFVVICLAVIDMTSKNPNVGETCQKIACIIISCIFISLIVFLFVSEAQRVRKKRQIPEGAPLPELVEDSYSYKVYEFQGHKYIKFNELFGAIHHPECEKQDMLDVLIQYKEEQSKKDESLKVEK